MRTGISDISNKYWSVDASCGMLRTEPSVLLDVSVKFDPWMLTVAAAEVLIPPALADPLSFGVQLNAIGRLNVSWSSDTPIWGCPSCGMVRTDCTVARRRVTTKFGSLVCFGVACSSIDGGLEVCSRCLLILDSASHGLGLRGQYWKTLRVLETTHERLWVSHVGN